MLNSELRQTIENGSLPQANVAEYLRLNNIETITYVLAHPDDLDGYAAGLMWNLGQLANQIKPENIRLIIATDGANGSKNLVDRQQLTAIRKAEQLTSLANLGWIECYENTVFLDEADSAIQADRLEASLFQEFIDHPTDLVITHDYRPWGAPSNRSPNQLEEFVQNHPDHRMVAKKVATALRKSRGVTGKKSKMLEATWDQSEANLIASYPVGRKKSSFTHHQSQYTQNHGSMDLIEDRLNYFGGDLRYEFFREQTPEEVEECEKKVFTAALYAATGTILSQPNYRLEEMLKKQQLQLKQVLTVRTGSIQDHSYTDQFIATLSQPEISRLNLIHQIRRDGIELLILDSEDPALIKLIDKILMFDASIAIPGINETPKPIRQVMIPSIKGNVSYDGKRYQYLKGLW